MHLSGPCVMLVMRAASITWASGRGLGPGNLEFFGPQMHSWAMPDLSVTSGTGLNHDAAMRQLTTGRNADAGLTFLRHLHVILQYHLVSYKTTSSFHCTCKVCHSTASSMAVQGVSSFTARSMDVQGVSSFTARSMDVQGVSPSTASSVNVQDVCPFPPPAVRTGRVFPFLPPTV
jgi:hypothetical protein